MGFIIGGQPLPKVEKKVRGKAEYVVVTKETPVEAVQEEKNEEPVVEEQQVEEKVGKVAEAKTERKPGRKKKGGSK